MKANKRIIILTTSLLLIITTGSLISFTKQKSNNSEYISYSKIHHAIPIFDQQKTACIILDSNDFEGVKKISKILASDIEKVTQKMPSVLYKSQPNQVNIIIGTIGKNKQIDELIAQHKIDGSIIKDKWETFIIQTVDNNLVIAGSDKRGTIYGILDLSTAIGVSPWYWWADVPIKKQSALFVKRGCYTKGTPKVKYRGIFINDEGPALDTWAQETFGGFNHQFYEKVYELILRNKGNFLWPAMWGKAFYDDDSLNAVLADEYGIVIGFSHHEPMMRSHVEWQRNGQGAWNYEKNPVQLQQFWRDGITRMKSNESIVTIGMRGDGDEPMTQGTAIQLMENIVTDQRNIIEQVTQKLANQTPQLWALYKEVQDYYNQGMQVPDDVTLLLCDDNWGNIRVLPQKNEIDRSGGFGMYYHFDYVGGPVSYKWLNVTQIERVWEQMTLAYYSGVDQIWLVNVGDIKPMELPISFFLDLAWNPDKIKAENLPDYYLNWAKQQFGNTFSNEIAQILALYTKYNARRNPEMLTPETYALNNYNEAQQIDEEYNKIYKEATSIYQKIDTTYRDAFYQLVLFPVAASANLNSMYVAIAKNHSNYEQKRNTTNANAEKAIELFKKDSILTEYYHTKIAKGKWNHIMMQTHIGYTTWNQPDKNTMPAVYHLQNNREPQMDISINNTDTLVFDNLNQQSYTIELFNQGTLPYNYIAFCNDNYIKLSSQQGTVDSCIELAVAIDWNNAPEEKTYSTINIKGTGAEFPITLTIDNSKRKAMGFTENNGVISIEASHFTQMQNNSEIQWQIVPNLGKTGSAITGISATGEQKPLSPSSASLTYPFYCFNAQEVSISVYISPVLNIFQTEGLTLGLSIDKQEINKINIHKYKTEADWEYPSWWNNTVSNRIMCESLKFNLSQPGNHILKIWVSNPGIVIQKIIIDAGGLKSSYLGPSESKFIIME